MGETDAKMGNVRCRGGRYSVSFAAVCLAKSCIATSVVSDQRSGQPEFLMCDRYDRSKNSGSATLLKKFTQDVASGTPSIEALLQTYFCHDHFSSPKLNTL